MKAKIIVQHVNTGTTWDEDLECTQEEFDALKSDMKESLTLGMAHFNLDCGECQLHFPMKILEECVIYIGKEGES